MFRILIVEDDEPTSSSLSWRLSRKIPEAQIDTAMTVRKAHELIEAAFNGKTPYDAVILDIKLPEDTGYFPEMDESICRAVKELMPSDTIVAHISAFTDDTKVKEHIKRMHDEQIDRSFRLSKLDPEVNFVEALESKLKSFLYGMRISEQMDGLFGPGDAALLDSRGRSRRTRAGDERSVTHELAALSRDIATYWKDLDDTLKARIKRTFEVDEGDRVIVSFF
jgi:CheY-like chemotaxis protein